MPSLNIVRQERVRIYCGKLNKEQNMCCTLLTYINEYESERLCFSIRHAQNRRNVVTNPQQTNATDLGRDSSEMSLLLRCYKFAKLHSNANKFCSSLSFPPISIASTLSRKQHRSLATSASTAALKKRADDYGGYFSSPIRDQMVFHLSINAT